MSVYYPTHQIVHAESSQHLSSKIEMFWKDHKIAILAAGVVFAGVAIALTGGFAALPLAVGVSLIAGGCFSAFSGGSIAIASECSKNVMPDAARYSPNNTLGHRKLRHEEYSDIPVGMHQIYLIEDAVFPQGKQDEVGIQNQTIQAVSVTGDSDKAPVIGDPQGEKEDNLLSAPRGHFVRPLVFPSNFRPKDRPSATPGRLVKMLAEPLKLPLLRPPL